MSLLTLKKIIQGEAGNKNWLFIKTGRKNKNMASTMDDIKRRTRGIL
jgi:hypothetical protein